jgi:hypothetical protein
VTITIIPVKVVFALWCSLCCNQQHNGDKLANSVKALAPAGLVHPQLEQAIGAPAPASFSQSIALTQNVHNMEQAMRQTTTAIGTLQQLVGKHVLDKRLTSY